MNFPIPAWYNILLFNYLSGNFHQFLFDGNIFDQFFWPDRDEWKQQGNAGALYPFREFLLRALLINFGIVIYYAPAQGLSIHRNKMPANIPLELSSNSDEVILDTAQKVIDDLSRRGVPTDANQIIDKILKNILKLGNLLKTVLIVNEPNNTQAPPKKVRTATVLDHLDTILSAGTDQTNRYLTEIIHQWGTDSIIHETGNISILITGNRELLPRDLVSEVSGTRPISIPLPDSDYRRVFFDFIKNQNMNDSPFSSFLGKSENVSLAIQLTRGFRIEDCVALKNIAVHDNERAPYKEIIREYFFKKANPTDDDIVLSIKEQKKDVIQAGSRGMLEPVESSIRFADIGGLDGVKKYFQTVCKAIQEKHQDSRMTQLIPKGVLLTGPPGTGKTLLAKALANESGISLVSMGDIRSAWVGESEKNMTLVLHLLKAMSPVIVFIDEIDQAIGNRAAAPTDSGVSGRIFGKILEFMGNNDNRGDVIWIAATNRADLLDDAMIRRFDRVIPVLLPGSREEWCSVISGIARQIKATIDGVVVEQFVEKYFAALCKNHSGSSIEMVIRFAYQKSIVDMAPKITFQVIEETFKNFKTNFNQRVYQLQTLLAIAACNERSFIPYPDGKDYSYGEALDEIIKAALDEGTNEPLVKQIDSYKNELYMSALR